MSTTRTQVTLAVAFVKLKRSRALIEAAGVGAWERVGACLDEIRTQIGSHRGTEIKTITGDTVLCTFPLPDRAVEAALGMVQALYGEADPEAGPADPEIPVCTGIAYGRVLLEEGDVFGHTVHVAARIAAEAKAGQILVDEATAQGLSSALRRKARLIDNMPAKGISEPVAVFEVLWDEEGATSVAAMVEEGDGEEAHLRLRSGDQELVVASGDHAVTLGRGSQADFCVAESDASRLHLRIEPRRGKFVATDESVNGTCIETAHGLVRLRRRESHTLSGHGRISLGCDLGDATRVVHYECA